ncbi:uncharacterized protein EDB93DRAFT_1122897 [Suillus bovinus]|uniref:uncharacterized protein n=1 Tax=Suillus bovinus TaxID=48563 RepID=UPI001B878382|nr:uncharacterized protein EDB93DRAFT_1122897 [Suillus bovinus]KAG2158071.1 hypothetical protein EDB93DRAFT_1122897 [Suillus bovinus]
MRFYVLNVVFAALTASMVVSACGTIYEICQTSADCCTNLHCDYIMVSMSHCTTRTQLHDSPVPALVHLATQPTARAAHGTVSHISAFALVSCLMVQVATHSSEPICTVVFEHTVRAM